MLMHNIKCPVVISTRLHYLIILSRSSEIWKNNQVVHSLSPSTLESQSLRGNRVEKGKKVERIEEQRRKEKELHQAWWREVGEKETQYLFLYLFYLQ